MYSTATQLYIHTHDMYVLASPGGSDGKESAGSAGDLASIPGSGRSPGEGNSNPLQYSCLKNPMVRGAWQARVWGVTNSWTRLSDYTFFSFMYYKFSLSFFPSEIDSHFCHLRLRGRSPSYLSNFIGDLLILCSLKSFIRTVVESR